MATAAVATVPITAETLERAGLRLELAASVEQSWQATGNETHDEAEFGRREKAVAEARASYRAMLELATGHDVASIERRMLL